MSATTWLHGVNAREEVLCCGRRRMKNIRRDEVDYLPEDRVYCLRCFWWFLFLHNHVGYRITPPVATLNIHPIANAVSEWDANETFYKNILEKL